MDSNSFKRSVCENTSFIMTVLNEAASITGFLESLFGQTLMPSEIIIVDGGSKDGTADLITGYFKNISGGPLPGAQENNEDVTKNTDAGGAEGAYAGNIVKLFEGNAGGGTRIAVFAAAGAKISQGRNIAIGLSQGGFICVSDAGCRLCSNWMHETIKSFKNGGAAEVVGGLTLPYAENFTQALLAVCMLPKASEINEKTFMPSSRNAGFTRSAWQAAGRYPDDMDFGEDMKFNFNLKRAGYKIKYNPSAKVYWNLRSGPAAVFKQFFRYAKGDAIGRMYPLRHIIRVASLLIFASIIALAAAVSPYFTFLLLLMLAAYSYRPYLRINYVAGDRKTCPFSFKSRNKNLARAAIAATIPFMLLFIDTAKLAGYFYGLFQRHSTRSLR